MTDMLENFWSWWSTLDAQTQAVLIGLATSALMGILKLWPRLGASPAQVKLIVAALIAGIGGYVNDGMGGMVLAILSALGIYDVWKRGLVALVERVSEDD